MKKKKILYLLLAATLVLSGCSKNKTSSESPNVSSEESEKASDETEKNNDEALETEDISDIPEDSSDIIDTNIRPVQSIITENSKSFYDERKPYGPVYEYRYDIVSLSDDAAKEFPQLKESLDNTFFAVEQNALGAAELNLNDAIDWCVDFADGNYSSYYSDVNKMSILRSDTAMVSVRSDFYDFFGGAHGNYGYYGYNFDTKTGKVLSVEDVFTSKEDLADIICTRLKEDYGEDAFYDFSTLKDTVSEEINRGSLIFDVDYCFANIFFNPYDIAPYASGLFEVHLPLKEYSGSLINEKYTQIPENFILHFSNSGELTFDLDGGGREDLIKINSNNSADVDYDFIESVSVTVNGQTSVPHDLYAYGLDSYLVKHNGKYYVYIFCSSENDYTYLIVYDINEAVPKLVEAPEESFPGVAPASVFNGNDYDDDKYYSYSVEKFAFVDPENMMMSLRTDLMSTVSVCCAFKAREDGFPYYIDKEKGFLLLSNAYEFTANMDLEGTKVDEDGNELGSFTMTKGTKGKYYRTDNHTYGDLLLEDGTIVRFNVDNSDWPTTVNGINIEEAFDGIIYAG